MKKLILTLGLLATVTVGAFAQGQLVFANFASGVSAPITNETAALISGSTYFADLLWGTSQATAEANDAGFQVAFATGSGAGFFLGGTRTINGAATGQTIWVEVVAYTASAGSYANAVAGLGVPGHSAAIQVTLGGGAAPTPVLTGLQGFQLSVPEPTTIALGGFGAAALLLFRRRK